MCYDRLWGFAILYGDDQLRNLRDKRVWKPITDTDELYMFCDDEIRFLFGVTRDIDDFLRSKWEYEKRVKEEERIKEEEKVKEEERYQETIKEEQRLLGMERWTKLDVDGAG